MRRKSKSELYEVPYKNEKKLLWPIKHSRFPLTGNVFFFFAISFSYNNPLFIMRKLLMPRLLLIYNSRCNSLRAFFLSPESSLVILLCLVLYTFLFPFTEVKSRIKLNKLKNAEKD